ncbi:hypothetical protein M0D69_42485 [Caballeronia sp. SEWSISQ10-4 2]|uniref:hypothetical protein n=1 Tax=Caballeronia sp. SEWSISQ10-4 2 TaxID=2937438 RepID=UPI00264BA836|nr:hypothetical protein [Caballeronia sp. SEWSISQ10-4 2]MDN7184572.1 hypothetical protein [Caballeronia sp. SEWSISQ10-4 2]
MSEPNPDQTSQETARLVLRMDAAISAFRAGQCSGVHALDVASHNSSGAPNDPMIGSMSGTYIRPVERCVTRRPNRVELAVLTVLADTYGAEMLSNSSLGYVLRLFARHGGVVFAQRVLFGESAADQQLSVMLTATRVALTQVSALFTEEFFAEANALIAGFRPRPPDAFKSPSSGRNE